MKTFLFFNWQQKLFALLLAVVVWAALKESVDPGTLDQILQSFGWRFGG
jgi:hypothetical protein